jgi:D-arabinose 1-dehydrogenase-like Zn-dependent alcohol dehydrogenase
MIVVGAGSDPIEAVPAQLLFGSRSLEGALTGSAIDNEDTLAFCMLQNVRPKIETMPLESAALAYGKMLRNEARFRMVLLIGK